MICAFCDIFLGSSDTRHLPRELCLKQQWLPQPLIPALVLVLGPQRVRRSLLSALYISGSSSYRRIIRRQIVQLRAFSLLRPPSRGRRMITQAWQVQSTCQCGTSGFRAAAYPRQPVTDHGLVVPQDVPQATSSGHAHLRATSENLSWTWLSGTCRSLRVPAQSRKVKVRMHLPRELCQGYRPLNSKLVGLIVQCGRNHGPSTNSLL